MKVVKQRQAAAFARWNAQDDPARRVELYAVIRRLRAILGNGQGGPLA